MPLTTKELLVKMGGDLADLKKSYRSAKNETKKTTGDISQQFGKMAKRIGAALSFAVIGRGLVSFAKVSIDATETVSKFGTVFENVMPQATAAMEDLRSSYGLSRIAAHDLLSSTGDLLIGLGAQEAAAIGISEKTQQMAVDLASFNNLQGGAARASEIMTKAMLGEREGLVALKIKISELDVKQRLAAEGKSDLIGKALLLAKAEATLALIQEQSGKAMGDYARTANDAANTVKRIGALFNDFQVQVGNSITESDAFQTALSGIKTILTDPSFVKAISDIVAGLMSMVKVGLDVGAALFKIVDVLKPLGIALVSAFAIGKIQAWTKGFTLLTASINAGNISMGAHIGLTKAAAVAQKLLGKALPLIAAAAAIKVFSEINSKLKELGEVSDKVTAMHIRQANQMGKVSNRFRDMRKALSITKEEMQKMIEPVKTLTEEEEKQAAEIIKVGNALGYSKRKITEMLGPLNTSNDLSARQLKVMKAIRDGKFDTSTHKLSEEYKKWTAEQLKANKASNEGNEEVKETIKLNEKLAASIGILTGKELISLRTETQGVSDIFNKYKNEIKDNIPLHEKFTKKINELINAYNLSGRDVPKALLLINNELERMKLLTVPVSNAVIDLSADLIPLDRQLENIDTSFQKAGERTLYFSEKLGVIGGLASSVVSQLSGIGIIGERTAKSLGDVADGISEVGAGIDQFKKAGKGFLGLIDKIGGGFSIATSAIGIFKSIVGLFSGPSGELEAANRRLAELNVNTDEWSKKIEELGKELGKAGADRAFNTLLADIIKDSDITIQNFDQWIGKIREVVSTYDQGFASIEETQTNFGNAFTAIREEAIKLGIEGGEAMTGLIMLVEEKGLKVKEVSDYIETNMMRATKGWMAVLEEMGGVSIPILDEQVRQFKLIESIIPETSALIQGATEALIGMSNAGRVLPEDFAQFGLVVDEVRGKLAAQGITGADAALAMKDLLNRMIFLSNEYGLKIDDNTQALINQHGEAVGLSGDVRSEGEKQTEIQQRMLDLWTEIAKKMGVVTDGFGAMGKGAEDAIGRINNQVKDWQGNLEDVIDTTGDVVDAIGDMGSMHNDVMWENSILPDLDQWYQAQDEINRLIESNTVKAIGGMGDEFTATNEKLKLQLEDVRGKIEDIIGAAGEIAFQESFGKEGEYGRYGIFTQGEKEDMSVKFKELERLWYNAGNQLVQDETGFANFVRDLEGLTVIDELGDDFTWFLNEMKGWQNTLASGKVWDIESQSFIPSFAGGTGGIIPMPSNFLVGETGPELVQAIPGRLRVTPLGGDTTNVDQSSSSSASNSFDIDVFVQEMDAYKFADMIAYVMDNKTHGINERFGV